MNRCAYVNLANPRYIDYHDHEWGRPLHDDRALFELLTLECFQAGLSWECVLNKRDAFRRAFEGFDPARVAAFGEDDIARLLADPGIIRNKLKVRASVGNAAAFLRIQEEFGSFDAYLWGFTDGEQLAIDYRTETSSALSDCVSADLKRRGMKFVGTTVVYSYLQAAGVIDAHEPGCDLYRARLAIRDATPADEAFILAHNEANVAVLSPLDQVKLRRMSDQAAFVWVVEANRMPAAYLIAFREDADYESLNYRWFAARHECFLYIDRIVVAEGFRGLGIGRALYERVVQRAREGGVPVVTAEIDLAPVRNQGSLDFHARMGFAQVGEQTLADGITHVSLQELSVSGGRFV